MANGIALNIGLNRVDPQHYHGWDGELVACEFDARDMNALAIRKGFEAQLLLTQAATATAVTDAIAKAAARLKRGDIFFLSYSGHGGQVPDLNGDEADELDESWVFYDRQLVDDELYALWAKFQPGVRILMLSDSCHSGSMARATLYQNLLANPAITGEATGAEAPRTRAMPANVQGQTYYEHQQLYDDLQRANPKGDKVEIGASVVLLSGCQDNQLSSDGLRNGLFTQRLLQVWAGGAFHGRYRQFYDRIKALMPPIQTPNYYRVGRVSTAFEAQVPFTI